MKYIAIKRLNFQGILRKTPPHVKIILNMPDGRRYSRLVVVDAGYFFVARGLAWVLNCLLRAEIIAPELLEAPVLDMDISEIEAFMEIAKRLTNETLLSK